MVWLFSIRVTPVPIWSCMGLVSIGISTHEMPTCATEIFVGFEYTWCWEALAAVHVASLIGHQTMNWRIFIPFRFTIQQLLFFSHMVGNLLLRYPLLSCLDMVLGWLVQLVYLINWCALISVFGAYLHEINSCLPYNFQVLGFKIFHIYLCFSLKVKGQLSDCFSFL